VAPKKDPIVKNPCRLLKMYMGSGQDLRLFPWAHTRLAGMSSSLAAWDASDAAGHVP